MKTLTILSSVSLLCVAFTANSAVAERLAAGQSQAAAASTQTPAGSRASGPRAQALKNAYTSGTITRNGKTWVREDQPGAGGSGVKPAPTPTPTPTPASPAADDTGAGGNGFFKNRNK